MATPVLEMRNVEKNFGGVRAIDNFSVTLEPGKIHGLIGPNGAGKTTIFNNITGIYAPDSGKIIFNGTDITGSAPHRVAQLGIGRTFQNIRLFSNLSVLSNVVIASNLDATYNMADAIFKTKKYREREKHLEEKAMDLLEVVGLADKANEQDNSLPYGHQRKLEIARAMALDPKLLLLDEPVNGLDFQSTEFLYQLMGGYKQYGTLLFSSHILESICLTSDRVLVLEQGRISRTFTGAEIAAGTIREVLADDEQH